MEWRLGQEGRLRSLVMWYYDADHPLRRFFSGLAEHTFAADLGVADPPLIDYLSLLLSRFVHVDAIHSLQAGSAKALPEDADMHLTAEGLLEFPAGTFQALAAELRLGYALFASA